MTSKNWIFVFVFAWLLGLVFSHHEREMPVFKPAQKIPHKHELHGDVRMDDYFWMRERDTPAVLEYLRQENQRTALAMKPVAGLENKLYLEMRARVKEDDQSVPAYVGGYFYYTRYETGREYAIHCRKKGSLQSTEEIVLNENERAAGHDYFDVGAFDITSDQKTLVWGVDLVGRRFYELRFRDLETGKDLPDRIEASTPYVAWAPDNRTLFFVRQDPETLRAYQVFRYRIGSGQPELIYEEKDTTFNVGVTSSKNGKQVFMMIEKRDSSEWRVLDESGRFVVLQPREMMHEYSVVDGGDRFYILTNWQAKNFRVMEAAKTARSKAEWREIMPASQTRFREDLDVYAGFVVVGERENGLSRIVLRDRATGGERILTFPDESYELNLSGLPDYESRVVRFAYESQVQPPSVFEEDMASGKRELRKRREVPGYTQSLYETHRIWAVASDGVKVPMSIVHRKDLQRPAPVLMYGYGSYGHSNSARFWGSMFSLIDRGFVLAMPHIRGGSEMGREWYEQGRLKNKMNTFNDFIACAEKLIADGITASGRIHIMGGSAGGLLVGAVVNMRPELFKSVIAGVPFVDVLTTMLDETLPLTTGEYNEWGDPRVSADYLYMRRYSPYDNVRKQAYPDIFVSTGYHDSQVQYWEPAKWVARLREMKTDSNLLLMHTEFEAGHSGASGRFEALKLLAKEMAFILMVEGITE